MIKSTKIAQIVRSWHLLDATDQVLGRLSTSIIPIITGKNKPYFTHHLDCGDHVVIINSEKIKVTGRKEDQKTYHRYSGYPGGQRQQTLAEVRSTFPTRILEHAISGMLPDNKLKARWLSRLHLFVGENHDYGDKFKIADVSKFPDTPKSVSKTKLINKSK